MRSNKLVTNHLYQLWRSFSSKRRRQFCLLLLLMVLTSFTEVISIGAILPFLAVLTSPEQFLSSEHAHSFIQLFNINSTDQLLLVITILFAFSALLAGIMRLFLLWVSTRLSFAAGAEISANIYHRTLYQPYLVHVNRNSSHVINGISGKANGVIYSVIMPVFTLISSMIMMFAILVTLLLIQPIIAISAFCGFGLIYLLIIMFTRNQLKNNSKKIASESTHVIKALQEGLGGIRDILIDGNQAAYFQIYLNADKSLRRAQGKNFFISQSPRYGVEALGIILITVLAYNLTNGVGGITNAIPTLGALALGAQRLLPVLQQAYAAISSIKGEQTSLKDTLELLAQPLPSYINNADAKPLPFLHEISLRNIFFRYNDDSPWVLKNINITIPKGARIGLIGKTGSGKSTLIDIVMGLLQPSNGYIEVDGVSINDVNCRQWQAHIAHVPQVIFLTDNTIEENIAFGIPKDQIDHEQVKLAAHKAQLSGFIDSLPDKYQTVVGERGVRLSGGQRQRIGIARALYKEADIIIFDEATSALDSETESAVMQAIESLSEELTILIIAHRLSTLSDCTQIIELGDGEITRLISSQDINNKNFN